MVARRRKFQGVLNILSFNRHFYVIGIIVLSLLVAVLTQLPLSQFWIWAIIAGFLYGLLMPLVVSAYVYDFSGYYDFEWMENLGLAKAKPEVIVNINAGFDETSFILKDHFPAASLSVFDFYDASRHTEPAIVRARKVSLVYPNTTLVSTDRIPLEDQSADMVFLLSAAHEIRTLQERVTFLTECHRLCREGGKVVMVEHLRDLPNFLAFTIGFTHFFSRRAWEKAFVEAGFASVEETKFTPFMSIFVCTS
jgi:ubiquinone/menaquinone biosynthesis C-methylase UbiE